MGDDYQNKDSVAESSRLGRENDMHDIFRRHVIHEDAIF